MKEIGPLSVSQRQDIIKLIEKKDRGKRYIKNWRPISLLNVDTKMISEAFAEKLKETLSLLISQIQRAYAKNIFVSESDRLIADIIDTFDKKNIPGYLVSIDIAKAFDSLDHDFLTYLLRKFDFEDNLIKWVKVLLNK